MKQKESVTLRKKPMSNGGWSLYLDYYISGVRHKEYLHMYLSGQNTKLDRETLRMAQAAKSKKILDIQEGRVGVRQAKLNTVLLVDYIQQLSERYRDRGSRSYADTLVKMCNWMHKYRKQKMLVQDVDDKYVLGFCAYLRGKLSPTTIRMFYANMNTILNHAYRDRLINENPMRLIDVSDKPKEVETEREYLTLDEVKLLAETPCRSESVKRAFLFSCFTGLRISDIEALTWDGIRRSGTGMQVEATMKKTGRKVFVPLSVNALAQLPPQRGGRVFYDLPCRPTIGDHLKEWVKAAGIDKKITFHCARHTNATLLLTYGADIYTVSKILGHADVATTQIYAKIVDKKKREAVELIPSIG